MSRTGNTIISPDIINYNYNNYSEITLAASNVLSSYNYVYNFDQVGNRLNSTIGNSSTNYISNELNQYTQVGTQTPTYDLDGNMLVNGSWTYTWDGENRLIQALKDNVKLRFDYDYVGRRISKKVFNDSILSTHTYFVYDNSKLAEELNALNNNTKIKCYTWQPGIIGLDSPLSLTIGEDFYYYQVDANKNVTTLSDKNADILAYYNYSPFGENITANGTIASENTFCFSSEYYDKETGLLYYNYRYYSPNLGRWIKRDIIEEINNGNMYAMVGNNPIVFWDILGLFENSESNLIFYEYQMYLIEMKRRQLEQQFMDWYNNELKDMDWINKLTPCPPKLAEKYEERPITESLDYLMWYSNPNRETAIWPSTFQKHVGWQNPDEDEWAFSSRDSIFNGFYWVGPIYHPGGYYELRTKNPGDSKAGNQCVYDKCGNLILGIPGAGTADRTSPNADFDNHQTMDVKPYDWAKQLGPKFIELYYQVRPHIYRDKYGNKHINSKIVY